MKKSILLVLGNLIKRDLGPTLVKKSEERAEKALQAEKALRAEELLKQQDAEQNALDTEDAEKAVDTEQVEVEDEPMDTLYGPAPGEGPDTADTI